MSRISKGRLQQGVGTCISVLVLVAIPVGITWRELYVEQISRRLLSKVET